MQITIITTLIMLILAFINIKSLKSNHHKDLKIPILASGFLGAFAILLTTLLDSNFSVDSLIQNAKFAITTAIFGMATIIIISVIEKIKIVKMDDSENLSFIATQVTKCENLDELPKIANSQVNANDILNHIKSCIIDSSNNADKNINSLIEANRLNTEQIINNHNENLKELGSGIITAISDNFAELQKTLKNQMEISRLTNQKLDSILESHSDQKLLLSKELEKLSVNFSQDIICAIDNLAKSYQESINEHFSQNFVRFNESVNKMIEWQEQNKQILLDSTNVVESAISDIKKFSEVMDNVILRDEKMIALHNDTAEIMQEYKRENVALQERLANIRELGVSASESLKTIDSVIIASVQKFEDLNTKIIEDINVRDERIFRQIEDSTKNIESLHNIVQESNESITKSYKNLNSNVATSLQSLASNINDATKESVRFLQGTMSDILAATREYIIQNKESLDTTITQAVNSYLESIERINLTSLQTSKDAHTMNFNEIKKLNTKINNYLKDHSDALNKTNIEILNIVDVLQKYVQNAIDMNNTIGQTTRENVADLRESISAMNDGLKGDYEWFLRRIREIIGQRL